MALGPTYGPQLGIQAVSTALGAPSFVNGLALSRTCRYVLEPQQHVMNVFPAGARAGANNIDLASPWFWNFTWIELVPPTVPLSLTVTPFFSLLCFPDMYFPSFFFYQPVPAPGGYGSFPMPAIPPLWTGKVVFQSLAFGGSGIELSTPCVIDVK